MPSSMVPAKKIAGTETVSWAMRQVIIMAMAIVFLAMAGGAAQAGCLSWKEAGPVISKNGLVPANVVYDNVQQRTGGKIVGAKLCQEGGRFRYKFSVLGPTGDVIKLDVDAKSGQF
jgi:hypothetical protein